MNNSNDRNAIEQTAQIYLDGLYEGDADKLASVFHEALFTDYLNLLKVDGRWVVAQKVFATVLKP